MFIGKRIKELRLKKGMTQLELANLLFVTDRTISKWEQEKGNPDYNSLVGLSTILDVSIDYLVTGKEYVHSNSENTRKAINYFESIIEQELDNEYCARQIASYIQEHSLDQVKDALDKCYSVYLSKSKKPYSSLAIKNAIDKIGGILYNQSLSPLDREISRVISLLSKNTNNPTPKQKRKCEITIKNFLSALTDEEEKKMNAVSKMRKLALDKDYSIYDMISLLERDTKIFQAHTKMEKRIQEGYVRFSYDAPEEIISAAKFLNKAIREKDAENTRLLMYNLMQKTFSFVILSIDKSVEKDKTNCLYKYVKDLKLIFGSFLSNRWCAQTVELVSACVKKDSDQINYCNLKDLNSLEDYLLSKIERHLKSGKNNFNYNYFK